MGEAVTTGVGPSHVAAAMAGADFLTALRDGSLPPPPFSKTMNILLTDIARGRVVVEGTPTDEYYNPMGRIHGGWIATLLDTAMACAIHSMLPAGETYTTLELKTNFVRPVFASPHVLRCEGVVLSLGGRIGCAEGKVFDQASNLVAHGTETCLIMGNRNGASQAQA